VILPLLAVLASGPLAPAPPKAALTAEEASELTRTISATVEGIRGLKFKRPVPVKIVDDATARAHFEARLRKFWGQDQARLQQDAHVRLGLLPAGYDVVAGLLDTLEEQAGGFYDPDTDTFFILKDMPRAAAPLLIAHELTHALDDQHFGIDALLEATKDDDDRQAAVAAVVEGSGTLVMTRFLLGEMQAGRLTADDLTEFQESEAGRAAKLKAAPPLLQRSLLASYLLGQTFLLRGEVMKVMSPVTSADLDRAFRQPPLSSEQVLHPEKYWVEARRDEPRTVKLPDLSGVLGTGWTKGTTGTLGELTLGLMAGAGPVDVSTPAAALPTSWTTEAVVGWGGDLYHHYLNGPRSVTVLLTRWDTEKDAQEFEKALKPLPGRRAWRRGDAVAVVAGDVADRHEALAGRVFEGLK